MKDLPEFLMSLGDSLGWDRDKYEGNISLQDDFLEQLHIPTYNEFTDILFWDVLQGLVKIYMVRIEYKEEKKLRKIEHERGSVSDLSEILSSLSSDDENQENGGGAANDDDFTANMSRSSKRLVDPMRKFRENERMLEIRIELEFETLNKELLEVMDVEELQKKETSLKKPFLQKLDN